MGGFLEFIHYQQMIERSSLLKEIHLCLLRDIKDVLRRERRIQNIVNPVAESLESR